MDRTTNLQTHFLHGYNFNWAHTTLHLSYRYTGWPLVLGFGTTILFLITNHDHDNIMIMGLNTRTHRHAGHKDYAITQKLNTIIS